MDAEANHRPRVGIPYRTRKEELSKIRDSYDKYVAAVREAGGEPEEISLGLDHSELNSILASLDAFVLPGSPADVHPSLYEAEANPHCSFSDPRREFTDTALLDHAFAQHKPVLAICYGLQSLNVYLGGTLIQDIPDEIRTKIQHAWPGHAGDEPYHSINIEKRSKLAELAGTSEIRVNSSHHQSVLEPGRNLRIVAHAPDGVVEALEWTGDSNWVTAVQWHPERMVEADPVARDLFGQLVARARKAPVSP